jgi:hypothetical protein
MEQRVRMDVGGVLIILGIRFERFRNPQNLLYRLFKRSLHDVFVPSNTALGHLEDLVPELEDPGRDPILRNHVMVLA